MSKQQQILAVFKPNAWLKKSDIARASDVDIGMAGYYLKQLVDEGKLSAIGATGDRMFALHGTAGATGSAPPPKAAPPRPAAPCNVTPFTPAMTADRRMVIVGGSEPLMFSIEQTQSIADLVLDNFEAR